MSGMVHRGKPRKLVSPNTFINMVHKDSGINPKQLQQLCLFRTKARVGISKQLGIEPDLHITDIGLLPPNRMPKSHEIFLFL